MANLKEYDYTINGVEFTAQLDEEDVDRYEKAGISIKEHKAPANKSRTATTK